MLFLLAFAAADLIVHNANVRTMDAARPRAEALAVIGERIVAVGSSDEVMTWRGPQTRLVDARGRLVLPGFNDAHVHFLSGGFQLSSVDLRDAATPEEFARRIGAFAKNLPKGRWITGGDWDHELWPGAKLPTRELIDAFTPDHPVFVNRLDGHMALANSLALRIAGVSAATADPGGGLIVRRAGAREPEGVLKDNAMGLVDRVIPVPSFEEKLAAARAATQHAFSLGVTSVQDVSTGSDIGVYQELARRGELKTRIYAARPLESWEVLARTGIRAPLGDAWLRVGGLKAFADGSLGSTTALFFDSYQDDPSTSGLQTFDEKQMLAAMRGADLAGLQLFIHAIGDRANHLILSMFEQVARDNGPRDRRFRIEHAQHLRTRDIARFPAAGVIASMQPYHVADDGRWAEKRIGLERSKTTYAFRTLLDSGATLAFGSDWTVAPLNPLLGIAAAVTRRTFDGKRPGGWVPEQKITVEEAVRAYTAGSATAEFQEKLKGRLAPGFLADFVILSADIFSIKSEEIEKAAVIETFVGGKGR